MNLREIMNVLKTVWLDERHLIRMLDLIHEFVTRGPVEDHLMDEVMQHWPRPENGMSLWRVINLDEEQVKRLGRALAIPTHRYLSWTSDESCIRRLAHARSRRGPVAVIHMTFPAQQICVDVQSFVEYLHEFERNIPGVEFNTSDIISYADESEVIVNHPTPLILNHTNTKLFSTIPTEAPKIGDLVFQPHNLSEDGYKIEEVLTDNGDGTWDIVWFHGEDRVHNVAPGEWEVISNY